MEIIMTQQYILAFDYKISNLKPHFEALDVERLLVCNNKLGTAIVVANDEQLEVISKNKNIIAYESIEYFH